MVTLPVFRVKCSVNKAVSLPFMASSQVKLKEQKNFMPGAEKNGKKTKENKEKGNAEPTVFYRVYQKKCPKWKIASTSDIPQDLGYFLQPRVIRSPLVYTVFRTKIFFQVNSCYQGVLHVV